MVRNMTAICKECGVQYLFNHCCECKIDYWHTHCCAHCLEDSGYDSDNDYEDDFENDDEWFEDLDYDYYHNSRYMNHNCICIKNEDKIVRIQKWYKRMKRNFISKE